MIAFELAVTPTVQKNNQIHLQLNPKVRHFDGFIEYGGPSDPTELVFKRLPSIIRCLFSLYEKQLLKQLLCLMERLQLLWS